MQSDIHLRIAKPEESLVEQQSFFSEKLLMWQTIGIKVQPIELLGRKGWWILKGGTMQ